MSSRSARMKRAALAGVAVFAVGTVGMVLVADDVRQALVSVGLVGVPVLAAALGVIWLLGRPRAAHDS